MKTYYALDTEKWEIIKAEGYSVPTFNSGDAIGVGIRLKEKPDIAFKFLESSPEANGHNAFIEMLLELSVNKVKIKTQEEKEEEINRLISKVLEYGNERFNSCLYGNGTKYSQRCLDQITRDLKTIVG